jgi:hypothetical protein
LIAVELWRGPWELKMVIFPGAMQAKNLNNGAGVATTVAHMLHLMSAQLLRKCCKMHPVPRTAVSKKERR